MEREQGRRERNMERMGDGERQRHTERRRERGEEKKEDKES